jgi:hypothetical protein
MPSPRIAILSVRRCGAAAVHRLLAPALSGPSVGGQPFHWDNPWGAVSREFHEGSPERARVLLDESLAGGALFHHRHDAESWDFNQLLLDGLVRADYRLVIVDRAFGVDHLFSILVSQQHDCSDAEAVARLRERLQDGVDVAVASAEETRQAVHLQWRTQHWFDGALAACEARRLVCRFEQLFLRGVAGLAVVDELFAFAGLAPRNAVVDDASLLRFLWAGQHYTAGLAAYSPALMAQRRDIEAELTSLQAQAGADAARA